MNLGLLKKKRIEKNLTQEQLGNLVGVSGAYIQQIERGVKTNPSLDVLHKIASALGVLTRDLIGFTESEEKTVELLKDLLAKNPNEKRLSDLYKKVAESGYLTVEDIKTIQDYANWYFQIECLGDGSWTGVPKPELDAYQFFVKFMESLGYNESLGKSHSYLYRKCKAQLEIEIKFLDYGIIKIRGEKKEGE